MEFTIKKRVSVDINFDGFIQEEKELTEKQLNRIERQNIKDMEDELRDGMVIFRKYVMDKAGGSRKKLLKMASTNPTLKSLKGSYITWEDFKEYSIFFINNDISFGIDILEGASDFFMTQLHNEDTELNWMSYSAYYDSKGKYKPTRKSKRSLEDFLIDTTTGIIMNSNEIDLEIAKLIEQRKIVIKNEKADMVKKMKEDIKKYGITRTELSTAFKKKRKAKVKPTV